MVLHKDDIKLVVCIAGIYIFYLWYLRGMLLTGLNFPYLCRYAVRYGPQNERFSFSMFLLCVISLMNAFAAFFGLVITRKDIMHQTPIWEYALQAATTSLAMLCSFMALEHIDYPTQALAKSCKPIPVMLMGVFILKRKYSIFKYAYVGLIVAGIAVFMLEQDKGKAKQVKEQNHIGLALLGGSLLLDGLTGIFQEKLIMKFKPAPHHLMMYSNLWGAVFLGIAGAVTGELAPAIKFCVEYPMVLRDIFILGVTSALGQNFIYYTIHEFGSLNCSIMTTSRKFFTILCSVAWFGHSMTTKQWGGVGMVFTGLACDLYSSKKARDAKKKAV